MARCTGWRPVEVPHKHPVTHAPGTCRECWRPCLARTDGRQLCPECVAALVNHLNPDVRLAVLRTDSVSERDVVGLSYDGHAGVAMAARSWLAEHDIDPDDTQLDPVPAVADALADDDDDW